MRHVALKRLIAKGVDTFEHDPDFQVRFHLAAMCFWILNLLAGTFMVLFYPRQWVAVGVYYVFAISIYANWDTDYDACSAASAFKHAKAADKQLEEGQK